MRFESSMPQNKLAAGAPTRTPLEELTALPRPPKWIWRRGREGRGGEGKGRKEKESGGNVELQTTIFATAVKKIALGKFEVNHTDNILQNPSHLFLNS